MRRETVYTVICLDLSEVLRVWKEETMRNIYIAGVGMTRFGVLSEMNTREIAEEAIWGAIKDSGLKPSDIEVAYCGYAITGHLYEQELFIGQTCLREIGINKIPILRVEQGCQSNACAFR
jgi:acetyl-CoA acetyltransferase